MYLLDSNVFIEASNRYYTFDICPGFWKWLDLAVQQGIACSIDHIYDELTPKNPGKDKEALAQWCKESKSSRRTKKGMFIETSDEKTQKIYTSIVEFVNDNSRYTPPAKKRFLSKADPWLIAKAKSTGRIVVTHEVYDQGSRKSVKIPNVCEKFSVPYANTFDMLRDARVKFGLLE